MSRFKEKKSEVSISPRDNLVKGSTRTMFAVLCALALVLTTIGIVFSMSGAASAAEFDGGSGYADELIGDTGWKSDLITSVEPDANVEQDGSSLVNALSEFFNTLGIIIIAVSILLTVARFAGRGIAMILFSNGRNVNLNRTGDGGIYYNTDGIWRILLTAEERGSGAMNLKTDWVFPMAKETVVFLTIGIGAGGLMMVIAGISMFVASNLIGATGGSELGDFSVSGINVTTK